MFTWTNQPYETMWQHLLVLTHSENVKKLLQGKLKSGRTLPCPPDEILEKKSRQVAYSIRQAFEYFHAADSISIITNPLLFFYGMLSLSKALVVANTQDQLLDDIKYHGLQTRPITKELKDYLDAEQDWCIEKEYAVTNDGVFKELSKLTSSFEFPKDSVIRYQDILSVDPELSAMYNKYYETPAQVYYLYSKHITTDPLHVELCPRTNNREEFEACFPYIIQDFDFQGNLRHNVALIYRSKQGLNAFPETIGFYSPIAGGNYLVGSLSYKVAEDIRIRFVPPEICDYLNMFILSNCVRYKQDFWGRLVAGEVEGGLGLINLSISIMKNRFPNYILSHLFNEKFDYGIAGRLV
jgi:hypothetical protein